MQRTKTSIVVAIAAAAIIIAGVSARQALATPAARCLGDLSLTHAPLVLGVKFGCKLVKSKLVCGEDINDDHGDGGKKHKKKDEGTQGERSCPPGYVVLDKPNQYGAFCEPKEGLPKPAPAEAEKCKFGMVGTPPNCSCPFGSQFSGSRGCLKTCCGTPNPQGGSQYVQCNADASKARSKAIALANSNSDPGTNVTCELTDGFPPEPD